MKELVNKIETIVGPENVLANESDLLAYEFDGLTLFSGCPLAVALPKTTKEIPSIVRLCREAKQNQLDAIDARIEELTKYRTSLYAELKRFEPANSVNEKPGSDLDAMDGGTHDG